MPDATVYADFLRNAIAHQQAGIEPHEVNGRRVWLKKAGPRNPRWRYWLLGALAGLLKLDVLKPVMNLGGDEAIAHEARRLRELAALGIRVPDVLAQQADGLLISDLGEIGAEDHPDMPADTLLVVLAAAAREGPAQAIAVWRAGLCAIADVHARGGYLSQAFARNLVCCPDGGVGFIDFEDDPGHSLDLAQCQARDWLSYMHSAALYLVQVNALDDAAPVWHATMAGASPGVRALIERAAQRMHWLRKLPDGTRWGTDTLRLRSAALFFDHVSGAQRDAR